MAALASSCCEAKNEAAPSFPRRSAINTLSMTDMLSNSWLV